MSDLTISKWKIIGQLWKEHQENPKFSGDLSLAEIYDEHNEDTPLVVNHSFILNNHKKLTSIAFSLTCLIDGQKISLNDFGNITISKKYKLPTIPIDFYTTKNSSNYSMAEKIDTMEDNKDDISLELNKKGGLSNLIPFVSKITSNKVASNDTPSTTKTWSPIKLSIGILSPLIILTIIYFIVIAPTNERVIDNKRANTNSINKKSKSLYLGNKPSIRKRRTTKIKKYNNLKNKAPASIRKDRNPEKKIRKSTSRRKRLMNKRSKILPASIDTSQPENEEIIDENEYPQEDNDTETQNNGDENQLRPQNDEDIQINNDSQYQNEENYANEGEEPLNEQNDQQEREQEYPTEDDY